MRFRPTLACLLLAACAAPRPAPPRPAEPVPFVRVAALDDYRGQPTFRIETGTAGEVEATYYYHRRGGGFASLIDRDGRDWISWRPGGGPDGEYRGIPNLGIERCCHPGYGVEGPHAALAMTSTLEAAEPQRAVIRSVGAGGFDVRWTFTPTHATLEVLEAPKSYWFLYEGTPGGALEEGDRLLFLSNGRLLPVTSARFEEDLPDPEWVAFLDGALERSLFFAHHEPDTHPDTYFRMGSGTGGMTVWGVGRGPGLTTHLTGRHRLTIGLVETRVPAAIEFAVSTAVAAP